jgi:hypothetical protein
VNVSLRLSMARRIGTPRHRHHRSEQHDPTECVRACAWAGTLCDRRVGRGRGRGGFGDGQGGWGAGGGTVPSVQIFSHTTQVHHAHANHPHVHAARCNHGEQGARVSTRRRKGVDAWSTRSGRRPSADSTTAQTHTSSQPQPKRAVLARLNSH